MRHLVLQNSGLHLIHWLVSTLAVLLTAWLVPGFYVSGFFSALAAAVIIAIANTVIWPVLIVLTLPINVVTLGLFTFVVNGAVIKMCAALIPGFEVRGWLSAIVGALFLSLIGTFLHFVLV